MARRTKVIGIAGRFGPRYGSTLRKRWRDVMKRRYDVYVCPFCGAKTRMKRISIGVWQCPKCGRVFAGGAYQPITEIGSTGIIKSA